MDETVFFVTIIKSMDWLRGDLQALKKTIKLTETGTVAYESFKIVVDDTTIMPFLALSISMLNLTA